MYINGKWFMFGNFYLSILRLVETPFRHQKMWMNVAVVVVAVLVVIVVPFEQCIYLQFAQCNTLSELNTHTHTWTGSKLDLGSSFHSISFSIFIYYEHVFEWEFMGNQIVTKLIIECLCDDYGSIQLFCVLVVTKFCLLFFNVL